VASKKKAKGKKGGKGASDGIRVGPASSADIIKNYLIKEGVDRERAREIADENKLKLFSKFLSSPRDEEVAFVNIVKEYDSFWFIRGSRDVTFEREVQYRMVLDDVVEYSSVGGMKFEPLLEVDPDSGGRRGRDRSRVKVVYIPVIERCHVELGMAVCVNANTGTEDPEFLQLLESEGEEIDDIETVIEDETKTGYTVGVSEMKFGINAAMDVYNRRQEEEIGELESVIEDREEMERGIVYVGRYNITYRYAKEKRAKSVHVGAYSGYVSY